MACPFAFPLSLWATPLALPTDLGVTVFEVVVDDTDCEEDEEETEEDGVNVGTDGTLPFAFPFVDFALGRGDSGVAVCVELLDSEDMEGAGDAVRDDSADSGDIVGSRGMRV